MTLGLNYESTYYEYKPDNIINSWSISTKIIRPEFRYYFSSPFHKLFVGANFSYNRSITKYNNPNVFIQLLYNRTYKLGLPIGFQYNVTKRLGLEAKLNYNFYTTGRITFNGLWYRNSIDCYLSLFYTIT